VVDQLKKIRNNYIKENIDFVDFWHGEVLFKLSPATIEIIDNELKNTHYNYPSSTGNIRLISALAKKYNVSANNILVSNGIKTQLQLLIDACFKEDDEVLLVTPIWSAYKDIFEIKGIKVHEYKLEEDFSIDLSKIIDLLRNNKIKYILLNNPNNPLGLILPKSIIKELVEIAKKNEVMVISDEVFSELVFNPDKKIKDSYSDENLIIFNSASKSFGLPGFKLSYLVAPKYIIRSMGSYAAKFSMGVPDLIQLAFLNELNDKQKHNKDISLIKEKFLFIKEIINKSKFLELDVSEAGLTLFPRVKKEVSLDWALTLLEKHKVSIIPGSFYGYSDRFRMCYGHLSIKEIQKGLDEINSFLEEVN